MTANRPAVVQVDVEAALRCHLGHGKRDAGYGDSIRQPCRRAETEQEGYSVSQLFLVFPEPQK